MPKATVAVGLVAMMALIAGCGSSDSSTTDSGDSFAASADAVCSSTNPKVAAIPQPTQNSEVSPYLDQIVPIFADAIDQLKELDPPSEDQDGFDSWVSTLETEQDLFEKARDEAKTDPEQAVSTLQGVNALNKTGNEQAQAIGLTTCGEHDSGGGSSGGSSS